MMNCSLDSNLNLSVGTGGADYSVQTTTAEASGSSGTANLLYQPTGAWDWWTNTYYPQIIRESYPVYIQHRAEDKGKQAFEIIKHLQDKKLMRLDTVKDFVEAMDTLLKVL